MGTRGLTLVSDREGHFRIAQYGQWDHYPSGQGATVLEFARDKEKLACLELSLPKCYWLNQEELEAITRNYANEDGWMSIEEGERFSADWPTLTRDTGAGILEIVANASDRVPLWDDSLFASDTVWCEGIYHINFGTWKLHANYNDVEVSFDLDNLPTVEEFLNAFAIEEEMV